MYNFAACALSKTGFAFLRRFPFSCAMHTFCEFFFALKIPSVICLNCTEDLAVVMSNNDKDDFDDKTIEDDEGGEGIQAALEGLWWRKA